MSCDRRSRDSGFSLVEAVIAAGLLAAALASLAQMFAIALSNGRSARAGSYAVVLAAQKLEELRALSDSDLRPSPSGSLDASSDGWADYLDDAGNVIGGGASPPPNMAYTRRWAVEPLPSNPATTMAIQVRVSPRREPGQAARLTTLRARKP